MKNTIVRTILTATAIIASCLALVSVHADEGQSDTNALPAGFNQITNQPPTAVLLNFTNSSSDAVLISIFDNQTNRLGWCRTNRVVPLVPIGQPIVIRTNLLIMGWLGSYVVPPGLHAAYVFTQKPVYGILVTNSGPISVGLQ